jgi:hypothetical protein
VTDRPGPPTLSLALRSVIDATMDSGSRTALLAVVQPGGADQNPEESPAVVPFPTPRRPMDDGPDAA